MPKKQRLTGGEIRRLKPEKRLVSSLFSLSYARDAGAGKAACVVSKKVSARAVDRNTVKRRMRAALRSLAPLPPRVSMVIAAKKAVMTVTYTELRTDLESLVSRIHGGK
jgi:ribonuclease P protein component